MEIEITNLTDNKRIDCASFSFVPFGTGLPGFFQSQFPLDNTPIWCKDWTPVTINLDSNAGKTIRLLFRTGDCTFRRHFGYAYIDVDTDCSGEFVGASFCPDDDEISVSAPFGFMEYRWFNSARTQVLGTGQILNMRPPPPSGTSVAVELKPYPGFGCEQTLTARLVDNLNFKANAGRDTLSCNLEPARIGSPPRPGLVYSWSPLDGIANPTSSNPLVIPSVTTNYVLKVSSPGGGCIDYDTVRVIASNLASSLTIDGKPEYCIGSPDSVVFHVANTKSIQWFRNQQPLPGETSTKYRALSTGNYYARLQDEFGCTAVTREQIVNISSVPNAEYSVNNPTQCFIGNRFIFINSSTAAVGNMQYSWDFGAGNISEQPSPQIIFTEPGIYKARLWVRTNSVCVDSAEATITVYPNPKPEFEGSFICEGLPFIPINNTDENIGSPIRYEWNYGNGEKSNERTALPQVYDSPGNFNISLTVSSEQCPNPPQVLSKTLTVQKRQEGRRLPAVFAVREVPLNLRARQIGAFAEWTPIDFLSNPKIFNPVFIGTSDRDYVVTLTSEGGCVTIDSLLVQIVEKANIYVPNAFTPNGDGLNDVLRPVLMGIAELKYFKLYNRWGELIYETSIENAGWNGLYKGMPQASQTFSWIVEGVGLDGNVIQRKGSTLLMR
jgi:gliding motility-associated-like protein